MSISGNRRSRYVGTFHVAVQKIGRPRGYVKDVSTTGAVAVTTSASLARKFSTWLDARPVAELAAAQGMTTRISRVKPGHIYGRTE